MHTGRLAMSGSRRNEEEFTSLSRSHILIDNIDAFLGGEDMPFKLA
jgi:hypothetical protein